MLRIPAATSLYGKAEENMSYVGKTVVIPPGTEFFTNYPKYTNPRVLKRVYRATILMENMGENPFVQWRYRGAYWAWTHPDNVRVTPLPSWLSMLLDETRK